MTKFKGLLVLGIILVCVVAGWSVFSSFNSDPTNHKIVNIIEKSGVDLVYNDYLTHSFDAPLKSDFWGMFGLDFNVAEMHVKATGYANFVIDKPVVKQTEGGFIVELQSFHYKGFTFKDLDTDTDGVPCHIKEENLDDVTNKLHGYVDEYVKDEYMPQKESALKQAIKKELEDDVKSNIISEFGASIKVSFVWL